MLEIPLVTIGTRNSASAFFRLCILPDSHKKTTLSLNIIKGSMFAMCFLRGGNGLFQYFNLSTPNDNYSGRTAPLTSKRFILYIYSTNRGTEYFKHGTYSPFLSLQNAVCFIILTYLVPVLFTFYIQGVLKFKK